MSSDARPLAAVPSWLWALLAAALAAQIAWGSAREPAAPAAAELPPPPSAAALQLASFGEPEAVARIASQRENRGRLPGITVPDGVLPTQSLAELAGAACLLVAVPAQVLRSVVRALPAEDTPLVIAAKGLERASGLRQRLHATGVAR